MGTPSVDHVMSRLAVFPLAGGADPYHHAALEDEAAVAGRKGAEATAQRRDETKELVDAEEERTKVVTDKVRLATAVGRFWWEADMEALGEDSNSTRSMKQTSPPQREFHSVSP
jgi:hypothetical protein